MRKTLRAVFVAALGAFPLGAVGAATVAPAAAHAVGVFHDVRHDTQKSTNWSGYAVTGSTKFTEVVGSWKEPTATCSSGTQYASFWVGIDGYSSQTVEQLGTDSDCSGGSPQYYGWYEMYPAGSVNLGSKYPVKPGDRLRAEVKVSGTSFTLSMKNSTEGWTFSTTKTGSGLAQSSAEWVIESPEICSSTCKIANLADYGKVVFYSCQAAAGGSLAPISSFTGSSGPHDLVMYNSSKTIVRSQPGKLGTTGKSFTTVWKHE